MLSGLDGSQWLFEKSTPTSYHLVDFWTPLALTLADGSEDPKMTQFIDKENIRSPVPYAQLGIRFMLEAGFASEEDFTVIEPDPNADPTDPFADP